MTNFLAVTTCNAVQWKQSGQVMVRTYLDHWPSTIPLRLYAEDFWPEVPGIELQNLQIAAPWLEPWKNARSKYERGFRKPTRRELAHTRRDVYTFKLDAVKFSHKIAAIGAGAEANPDVLIWLDIDIVSHAQVTTAWLEELFPPHADVAWLNRGRKYPECGFLMFRFPKARLVIDQLLHDYQTGAIFQLEQTHDSFVIQHVVQSAVNAGAIQVVSLSGNAVDWHHPLVAGPLGACLDHLKGKRKEYGKSLPRDMRMRRLEPYWNRR